MVRPIRVSVWGAGNVGGGCIRELARLPEFELASVLVASAEKHHRDIGELLGIGPLGVKATTDKEEFFGIATDCVLYAGLPPIFPEEMNADIIQLLESGINVISNTAYHFPHYHGQAYVERLHAACVKGGSRLHGTGENPGFMLERLAVTLTGLVNSVENVTITEYVDCHRLANAGTITFFGFGVNPETLKGGTPLEHLFENFMFVEALSMASMAIYGRMPDKIDHHPEYITTDVPIEVASMTIEPGTVGYIKHRLNAIVDGRERISIEVHWYMRPENKPRDYIVSSDHWEIEIEGRPCSMRMSMDLFASVREGQEHYPGDPTSQTYYATAATMIQAIPRACSGPPGIIYPSVFAHSTRDFRTLADRRDITGLKD